MRASSSRHSTQSLCFDGLLATYAASLHELAAWPAHFPERIRAQYASARAELGIHTGQGEEAWQRANIALDLFRATGNRQAEAIALHHCARAQQLLGERGEAARLHKLSLRNAMDVGDKNMCVRNIIGMARLASDKTWPAAAARLLAAARAAALHVQASA